VQQFANLETGYTYSIVEGSEEPRREPFRPHRRLPEKPVEGDNAMRLHDAWFMQPIPLPDARQGPGLFVVKERTPEYETFRRYLFDWRTTLQPPLAMLLNRSGEVVKIYGSVPSQQQVAADLARLANFTPALALPFDGFYIHQPSRDFFKFGAAFLWAGLPEKALPYLERVLAQTPNNPRVLVLAGQIQSDAGRMDKAAEYFQRALRVDPLSAEAANWLGLALAKQGQLDQARKYFEQAIAARRDFAEAINNLGVLYIRQGKINDAIGAFRYGIRVAPDEDILYLNLGRTYVQMGRPESARVVMQQLLARKPDNETARRALQDLAGH
jgi:tetratricopeptide (TPR) repeat protein